MGQLPSLSWSEPRFWVALADRAQGWTHPNPSTASPSLPCALRGQPMLNVLPGSFLCHTQPSQGDQGGWQQVFAASSQGVWETQPSCHHPLSFQADPDLPETPSSHV